MKDPMEGRSSKRMGQMLDDIQSNFITSCLKQEVDIHSILDVGGGAGRFAIPLQNMGYQVTVTEIEPQPLWYLKTKNQYVNAVLTGKQSRVWPIKDKSVECVLAIEIPTIVYQVWFWQECYRVLKSNGIAITCLSNSSSYKGAFHKLRSLLRSFPSKSDRGTSEKRWYVDSLHTVVGMFEETGFQLCQTYGYNWLPMGKTSDSNLIPLFAMIERKLHLDRFVFQSPWVLLEVRV